MAMATWRSRGLISNSVEQSLKKDEILAGKQKIAYIVTSQSVRKRRKPENENPWYNRSF